jgi:hypothetical protein
MECTKQPVLYGSSISCETKTADSKQLQSWQSETQQREIFSHKNSDLKQLATLKFYLHSETYFLLTLPQQQYIHFFIWKRTLSHANTIEIMQRIQCVCSSCIREPAQCTHSARIFYILFQEGDLRREF